MRREKTAIRDALLFWRRPEESGQKQSVGAPVTDGQCLDDVAEVVVEGVVSLGEDGRIVEANQTFASTFGYELSAVAGKALKDFVAPVSREPVEKSLSVGLEKPFKAVGLKKDGTPVNVEMRAGVSAPRGRAVSVVAVREVTEREETEERLRRVEASYRNLVEQIPAVTYTQDPDSGHHFASVYLSPQAERMLGYTREEFASDAGLWVSLIHPEDRERVLAEDARTDETGEPFRVEYRLVAREGREVWVRDEAVLVRSEDGSSVCWQGVITEVTSRKRAEEALKESEERFRSVVQNSSDIVTMIGADGTIRYVSPAIERVLGYRPEEKVGTSIFDLVHPDDADRASGIFAEILERQGLNAQLEFRVPHKDGSWRYLEHVANNLLDDPAVGEIVVNSRDITERKRMSEVLEEGEERYRRQARDLALLHQVRTALAQELELSDVFRTIVEAIAEAYGYTQVSAYLLAGEELVLQHQVGYHQVIERIPVTEGVSGRAVRTGRPILLEDVGADPDFLGAIEGLTSEICVPLFDGGEVVGFFNVESMGGVRLTQDDLELMVALGEHVSVAVSRARLYTRVRESEERFRSMVQNSSDIITLVGADGAVRYVSPAIERVLGYRPEERVGKHALDLAHPEDLEGARRAFAEVLTSPGLTTSMAMWVRHKDGSWRHIETTCTNRLDEQGVDAVVLNSRDVTERKEAEEVSRESEQRFRSSFEDAAIGMALLTPDGRYLRANRSLCGMLGYTQEELMNMTFRDITHPDDLEADLALGSRVLQGEARSFSMRKRYLTKDGAVVWVDLTVSLLRSDSGEPLYYVAQIQDVTERVRAEDALRQAEERYRTLVEQIPAITYVDSADGSDEPLYTSPQIEGMLGYTPEEWLGGRLWAERLHPDDRERILAADERFEGGAEERFGEEYRLLAKDGSVVWVREEAVLIEDGAGNPLFWQGVILDITKRKEAEEALRESEGLFGSVVRSSSEIVKIVDTDGTLRYASPAFESILGYDPEQAVGMNVLDYVHPEDLPRVLEETERALNEPGIARNNVEYRFRHADGTWRHVESVGTYLLDEPSVRGVVVNVRDVTERKEAEDRLREAEERYRTLVERIPAITYVHQQKPGMVSGATYVSPQVEDILGYTQEEYTADPGFWKTIVHPDDRDRVVAEDERTGVTGEPFEMDFRMIAKDGRVVWLRESGTLVRSENDHQVWHGVIFDITEVKRIEQGLRRAEEKYRALVEQIPAIIYMEEMDGRMTTIYDSPQIEHILGYPQDTYKDDPEYWIKILHPDDRERVLATEERAISRAEPLSQEYRVMAADGRVVWVRDEAGIVRDEAGEPLYWQGVLIDITERKETEDRLREAEERYRALVEQMPAVTYVQGVRETPRSTYVSPQVETMLGYTPEECASLDQWMRITHPADRRRVAVEDARTNETGEPFRMEYRVFAKDGRVVWVRDEATLVRDEEGNPSYWLGVQIDITDRKRAEQVSRESEQRLRTVVTSVPIVLFALDRNGVFSLSEGKGLDILGLEPGEVIGRSISEVYGNHPKILEDVDRALAGEEFEAVREIESRIFEVRYSSLKASTGELTGVIGLFADITERKEAEGRLREAEERYRTLVEQMPAVTYIQEIDHDNKAVYISPRMEDLTGYPPEAFEADRDLWYEIVHPDDRERVAVEDARTNETGEPFRMEYRLVARDGRVVWVRDEAVLVMDPAGQPRFWQGVMSDVTERRRAEEDMREANRRLEELAILKADFTAMVAHELDTPLAVIRGYADMLDTGELDLDEQSRVLDRIQTETDLLVDLISDVRTAAAVEREDFDIEPRPVAVGELLRGAITYGETLPGDHPFVTKDTTDGTVLADAHRIGQVLRNLVSNAAKYSPEGAPIELRAVPGSEPGCVRIEVADRGRGIHPHDATRIFEKFGRGRDRSGRKVSGVGLGLYLSRRILQAHGSELTLQSEPGGGSVFGFELRAAR